jgi:hypothetical protein
VLVFADTAWKIFSAAIIFLAGAFLAVSLGRFFKIPQKRAVFFYAWHTAFCLYIFHYSLTNIADSTLYYIKSLEYNEGLSLGTDGIYFLTSFFSAGLGLSYGGVFLVYNIFGFIGMVAFASSLQHVTFGASRFARQTALAIILMPGLSFWSSAIGKDALTFMAAGLATWGALDLSRRYPALFIATLAFLLARPHMAGILLACITFALMFASRRRLSSLRLHFLPQCSGLASAFNSQAWATPKIFPT